MELEEIRCSCISCYSTASFLCSTHQIQSCTPHILAHIKQIQSNHKLVPISILTLSQSDLQVVREAQRYLNTDWQNKFTINLPQFESENLDSTIKMFTKKYSQELSQNDIYLRKVKDLFKNQFKNIKKSISINLVCFNSFVNFQTKNKRLNLLDELQILKNIQIQKTIYPVPHNQIMICTHFAKIRKKLNQNYSQNIFKQNWRKGVFFLRQELELLYNNPQRIQKHTLNDKKLSNKDDYLKAIIQLANQSDQKKLFSIVMMSKHNKKIKYASGKCMTILNKSGFPLLNRKDLKGIQIPYSDLSGANFSYSNLKGSNLKGSILQAANFTNANLDQSILIDIFIEQGSRIFLDCLCFDISISPCGSFLATGSLDSSIRILNISQGRQIWKQENLIQFQGNNYDTKNFIELLLIQWGLEEWKIENFPQITDFDSYRVYITKVSFSNSGRLLACGRLDGKIIVLEDNQKVWEGSIIGPVWILKFSPYQQYLLAVSPLGTLKVWKNSQQLFSISSRQISDESRIRDLCFSQNEKSFYVSIRKCIFSLDLENFQWRRVIESKFIARNFDIDEREQYIAIGGYCCDIYNIQNNKLEYQLKNQNYFSSVKFLKDKSQRLITTTRRGWIFVWNFEKRQLIAQINTNINWLREISISQNNTKIACISLLSNCVRIIDFPQNLEKEIARDSYQSKIISFSPKGQKIASADTDLKIRLYNTIDGTLIQELEGHTETITNIFFSNMENKLLSSSNDGTIRQWNLVENTQNILIQKKNQRILTAEFSNDLSYIVLVIEYQKSYRIELWQTSIQPHQIASKNYNDVEKVKFSPFKQLLVVLTNKGYSVLSYSQNGFQELLNSENFPYKLIDSYFLNESQIIVFLRRKIFRWNLQENKLTLTKQFQSGTIKSVDITTKNAVVSINWNFIKIYDIQNFQLLKVISQTANFIKISPCQQYFVAAYHQGVIKSWSLQSQKLRWSTVGMSLIAENLSINEAKLCKEDEELLRCLHHF